MLNPGYDLLIRATLADERPTLDSRGLDGIRAVLPEGAHTRYLVARQEDGWVISFNGEQFGPYKSEREALLFAIDRAFRDREVRREVVRLRANQVVDGSTQLVAKSSAMRRY